MANCYFNCWFICLLLCLFWDRDSLCTPGWPQTHKEICLPLPLRVLALALTVCTTTAWLIVDSSVWSLRRIIRIIHYSDCRISIICNLVCIITFEVSLSFYVYYCMLETCSFFYNLGWPVTQGVSILASWEMRLYHSQTEWVYFYSVTCFRPARATVVRPYLWQRRKIHSIISSQVRILDADSTWFVLSLIMCWGRYVPKSAGIQRPEDFGFLGPAADCGCWKLK